MNHQVLQELSSDSGQREDGDGAETQEEFGSNIKFTLETRCHGEDMSSSESEEESLQDQREITLLYSGETASDRKARRDKLNDVADGTEAVDSFWLQKQVL